MKIGPAASTSWLAPGPMTPITFESEANRWATVDVTAGSNFVSPSLIFIVGFLPAAFHCCAYRSEKPRSSAPIDATGPVVGPK